MAKYGLDFNVISDENMDMANFFGISKWESSKDASHIYIANKENKIVYARTDYKGEGEKLKEIQSKLYSLFDLNESIHGETDYPLLIQGDDARDFSFEYINDKMTAVGKYMMSNGRLSDYYRNKNVLIAFYPAPYSYSCAAEVTRFDTYAEEKLIDRIGSSGQNDLELLMVSVSNYYILEKWKKDMGFDNVKLVSDDNGEISMKYNSYNMLGWNKRTVFLINKEGKVQYIDWDYNVEDDDDFGILKEQITSSN
jgi:alkyl hydroperoxide reductase subunit AhpC